MHGSILVAALPSLVVGVGGLILATDDIDCGSSTRARRRALPARAMRQRDHLLGAVRTNCGAGTAFLVRCFDNTPHLGYYQSESNMQILAIFYDNRSLLIADRQLPEYFNESIHEGCRIPAAHTSSQLVPPFSISSVNQNLIFYNCTKPPSPGVGLVETVCHNNTFVRAADERSDDSGGYFLEGCNATMVPVLGVSSGKINASNYEQLVWDGFLATWQWPPPSGNFGLGTNNIDISISLAGRGNAGVNSIEKTFEPLGHRTDIIVLH